jgi:Lysophospholipase L1 and related esterases
MISSSFRLPLVLVLFLAACGRGRDAAVPGAGLDTTARPDSVTRPGERRIVFLGTSLTAGYGLADPSLAYPALIQQRIDSAGLPYQVVNAGVSGATSADTRRSIDWIMADPVSVLVVETGANDGLRGLDVDSMRANIQAILDRARGQSPPPRLVLVGMEAPPNYGAEYTRRFREVFPDLARRNGAAFVPFLLQGVAGVDSPQPGRRHPPDTGRPAIVAATVWRVLAPLLR